MIFTYKKGINNIKLLYKIKQLEGVETYGPEVVVI